MKVKKYRIVKDNYLGYEVQIWRLWFPFWTELWDFGISNTHKSIEDAKKFMEDHKRQGTVVYSE